MPRRTTPGRVNDLGQSGVVTRQQALASGLSSDAIRARLEGGRWRRLHTGVYATFTGEVPRPAQLWAAVLAAGPQAALSHETAAELHHLIDSPSQRIHISVPAQRRVSPMAGVVVHLSATVVVATHPTQRPPRTRVEETVLDLVDRSRDLDEAMGWLTGAVAGRLTTPPRLRQALVGRTRMRWRGELTAVLGDLHEGAHSPLEQRYLRMVERAHGLPAGTRQAARTRSGGRYYDDVRYDPYGLHVELDGRLAHLGHARFRDLQRDNSAVAAGGVALRYGWDDVTRQPCAVAAQVATVLHLRGWYANPRKCGSSCMIAKSFRASSTQNSS